MKVAQDGKPMVRWEEVYEKSDEYRYGNINTGSGSTPTLMDDDNGNEYVVITDVGKDRTGLVVYRREEAFAGNRKICRIPLFQEGASAVEISPIGWNRTIIAKNDSGYRGGFHGTSEENIAGGIARIDIREDQSGCDVIWTSPTRVPGVVAKLSLMHGLIYAYTFHEQDDGENAWYFIAIDAMNGGTVYEKFIGAGGNFDISWGSPAIARDGAVYLGIREGIIALWDGEDS
jgi:hypothetical protein